MQTIDNKRDAETKYDVEHVESTSKGLGDAAILKFGHDELGPLRQGLEFKQARLVLHELQ